MRFDKIVFYTLCIGALILVSFTFGAYSAIRGNTAYAVLNYVHDHVKESIEDVGLSLQSNISPVAIHLQPNRNTGAGVTVNTASDQESLIFLAGFFDESKGLRLMRRNGDVIANWPVVYSDFFPDTSFLARPPANDSLTEIHGAVLNPDGSVVFNFEYFGSVKLSRCGEVEWTLEHPTHHSVERAEGGGYWISGRINHEDIAADAFPPFTTNYEGRWPYEEDLILKVSEEGEIVMSASVPQIFYDNGLAAVLTATGFSFYREPTYDYELLHLNKVGELSSEIADSFGKFEAGDLVISMRNHNLVAVVDPDTWKIRWHQIGPWVRQHDPEFNPDGTITVFNNNAYRYGLDGQKAKPSYPVLTSNIIRVDPATGESERIYGEREGEWFQTHVLGKHDLTPGGGMIITEYEAGRAFEINAKGEIVWEFINTYGDDHVTGLTEARVFLPSYFTVTDWSCP